MSHAAPAPSATKSAAPAADPVARFLADFENTCASYRLYGDRHPMFRRNADATVAATTAHLPFHIAINPRGFATDKGPVDDPNLDRLARKLRSFGLVGLHVSSPLSFGDVTALVTALTELDRDHANAQVAVDRIEKVSGGKVTVVPLRTEKLRMVEGTRSVAEKRDTSELWQDLFSQALGNGPTNANAAELAQALESALGASPSQAQLNAMVQAWTRQLAHVQAVPGSDHNDTSPDDAAGGAAVFPEQLDAVASFLQSLSPHLSQRLLAESVNGPLVPEPIVVALAQRLPAGIVLGALSAVDRGNAKPSQAALALLRKVSTQAGAQTQEPPPRTSAELARTASSLQRLLQSSGESTFVPDEYLRRRQELSRAALDAQKSDSFTLPDDHETARHTAHMALQILSTPEAQPGHVAAGLEFLRNRLPHWVRGGEFETSADAMMLARNLCGHPEQEVVKLAQAVLGLPLEIDDLIEGSRQSADPKAAADHVAKFLRQCDGTALASLLNSEKLQKPKAASGAETGGIEGVVVDAIRMVLTTSPEQCMRGLLVAVGDKAPQALLAAFANFEPQRAIQAIESVLPHCTGNVRRALLWQLFRRNIPWPVPLTERLLKDEESAVRRLAVMRLVRDCDPGTAAGYLTAAAQDEQYPLDVAVGLIELLRPQRRVPEVRRAFRRWFWSGRRWGGLFSFSFGNRRRAG